MQSWLPNQCSANIFGNTKSCLVEEIQRAKFSTLFWMTLEFLVWDSEEVQGYFVLHKKCDREIKDIYIHGHGDHSNNNSKKSSISGENATSFCRFLGYRPLTSPPIILKMTPISNKLSFKLKLCFSIQFMLYLLFLLHVLIRGEIH